MDLVQYMKKIEPICNEKMEEAKARWKTIAKPLFSLGKLEDAIIQIAGITRESAFSLHKKGLVIFCADNGVVEEGISQTDQEVTAIVAENFTKGNTSVCIMSSLAGVDVVPIDVGMARDVASVTKKEYKVSYGTRNFLKEKAMTSEEVKKAMEIGIHIAGEMKKQGYHILATGEMGIGNTTTSSAVASVLLGKPVEQMTGRGAGLDQAGYDRKKEVILKGIAKWNPDPKDPIDVLEKVGGLDIAAMTGLFLGAGIYKIPVVMDGFISAVAALCAVRLCPAVSGYILPSHVSKEPAAESILKALGKSPLLTCNMCLGEGTGAVALFPLLDMALAVYKEMSTFEEIQVEQYEDYEK